MTLLQKIVFILRNLNGRAILVEQDFKQRILPFVNTLAQRHLYAIYDEKITRWLLLALYEEVNNCISFVEMFNYYSFEKKCVEQTLQWRNPALRESDVLRWFHGTELETDRCEIEAQAAVLYGLLHNGRS